MNYMEQVAKMLGVEINEEFSISNTSLICKFVDDGLVMKNIPYMAWHYDNYMLRCLLSGEYEIIKKPILDVVEIEYLSAVIKPFRDRVNYIKKKSDRNREYLLMSIKLDDDNNEYKSLPSFERGTIYKGMEAEKVYSLDELGV